MACEMALLDEIEISESRTCKAYTQNQQEVTTEDEKNLHLSATLKNRGQKSQGDMK